VKKFGIGQSLARLEDDRLLKGEGKFTADINREDQVYGYVVRAPFASGFIKSIDLQAAKAVKGVLEIYTSVDLDGKVGPMPCLATIPGKDGVPPRAPVNHVLSGDRIRHVGEAVAYVVASSLNAAKDAAELIDIDYEELDAVVDVESAIADDAPLVADEAPGNISLDWEVGDKEGTDEAFKEADHLVKIKIVNSRVIPNAIEPRAALATYDDDTGFTLVAPSQGVWSMQAALANAIFHVPLDRMRVVTHDVGGGFGSKIFVFREYVLALFAARELGRPVKWVGDRSESFFSDPHGRDHISTAELALDNTGKILGYRVHTLAAFGAYLSQFGPYIPTAAAVQVLGGVYKIPFIHVDVQGVLTNTPATDAYRGAGRPEAAYLLERTMDAAAVQLGIGQDEIRRRNFIPESAMPYENATGAIFDSGTFEINMDRAMTQADWAGFPARRSASEAAGKLRGIGMAYYIECTLGPPVEEVTMNFRDDGRVEMVVGTQTNGQGHLTTFAQVIAERLGIDIEKIDLLQGDTAKKAVGGGTGGSRSLQMVGSATLNACDAVVEKGKALASHVLDSDQISFSDGVFQASGTNRTIAIMDLAEQARRRDDWPEDLQKELTNGLGVTVSYNLQASTFPNGCHICEVEVDPDTGVVEVKTYHVVDDVGIVVNPMIVEGQVQGGVAQGIGQALIEYSVFEAGSGQLLTGSFMDYAMPRADDMPDIIFSYNEVPCTTNPLGIKGCGEAGTIGAVPSTMIAIQDAVRSAGGMGARHVDMPVTPFKLWGVLNGDHQTAG